MGYRISIEKIYDKKDNAKWLTESFRGNKIEMIDVNGELYFPASAAELLLDVLNKEMTRMIGEEPEKSPRNLDALYNSPFNKVKGNIRVLYKSLDEISAESSRRKAKPIYDGRYFTHTNENSEITILKICAALMFPYNTPNSYIDFERKFEGCMLDEAEQEESETITDSSSSTGACHVCGAELIRKGAEFCSECGTKQNVDNHNSYGSFDNNFSKSFEELFGNKNDDSEEIYETHEDGNNSTQLLWYELEKEERSKVTHVIIPDGIKQIEHYMFWDCTSLKSLTIPDGVEKIDERAFTECSSLESINIPYGVKTINESTFQGCSSLEIIDIASGVKEIKSGAFAYCGALKSINVPESVEKIDKYAFLRCSSLESISIPNGIKVIEEGTFAGCTSLKSIIIPDSVTEINGSAFAGCNELKKINCSKNSIAYKFFEQKGILPSSVDITKHIDKDWDNFNLCDDDLICFNPANIVKAESLGSAVNGYWFGQQTECIEYKGYVYYISDGNRKCNIKRKKINGGNTELVVCLGDLERRKYMVRFGICNDVIYFAYKNEYKYENGRLEPTSYLACMSIYGGKIEMLVTGDIYNPMVFKTHILYFKDNRLEMYDLKTREIKKITRKIEFYNILGVSDDEIVTDNKVIKLKEAICKNINSIYKESRKQCYSTDGIGFVDCKKKIIYRTSHKNIWAFTRDGDMVEEWDVGFNDDNRFCYKYFDGKTLLKIQRIKENETEKGLIKFEKDGSKKILYRSIYFAESRVNVCGNHIYFYEGNTLMRINMDGSGVIVIE